MNTCQKEPGVNSVELLEKLDGSRIIAPHVRQFVQPIKFVRAVGADALRESVYDFLKSLAPYFGTSRSKCEDFNADSVSQFPPVETVQ